MNLFEKCANKRQLFQDTCIKSNLSDIGHPRRIQQMKDKKEECENIIQFQTHNKKGGKRKYKWKKSIKSKKTRSLKRRTNKKNSYKYTCCTKKV